MKPLEKVIDAVFVVCDENPALDQRGLMAAAIGDCVAELDAQEQRATTRREVSDDQSVLAGV